MATGFEGLFSDPNEIRSARIDALAKQQAQNKNLSLLNQVAAGRGAQIAEGLSGMFGLKTAEEAKATKLQQMASNFDTKTPEGLAAFAKALNDAGMTKEAVVVLKQREAVVDRTRRMAAEDLAAKNTAEDRARKLAQGTRREGRESVMVPKLDSKGRPVMLPNGQMAMEPKTVYYAEEWNDSTKKWERVNDKPNSPTGKGFNKEWAPYFKQGSTESTSATPAGLPIDVKSTVDQPIAP